MYSGNGSSIVLGERSIASHRVLVFSTTAHLTTLARARTLSVNGTFRVTPRLYFQTLIVCAEVVEDVWTPVVFGLLPNKEKLV